ncbi:MAG: hypothetical protein AAFO61_07690 [Pseudomonadota bacterium]
MTNILIPNTVDGYGANKNASISQDGRFIVYTSQKISELPPHEFYPIGRSEVVLFDTVTQTTTVVSENMAGIILGGYDDRAVISDNGEYIAYIGSLDPQDYHLGSFYKAVFLYDIANGTSEIISNTPLSGVSNSLGSLSISSDGQRISYQSSFDETGSGHQGSIAYVYDQQTDEITATAIRPDGNPSTFSSTQPQISGDGNVVLYTSRDPDLSNNVDLSLKQVFGSYIDTDTNFVITTEIAPTDYYTNISHTKISANGAHIAISATTAVFSFPFNYYAQIYVHNTKSDEIKSIMPDVSLSSLELSNSDLGISHDISANGAFVVYDSSRHDIVLGDTNDFKDIFVHNVITGQTARVSVSDNGTQANGASYDPTISADGQYITFHTEADNLVEGDDNGYSDIVRVDNPLFGTSAWQFGWMLGWNYQWGIGWGSSWHVGWFTGWNVGWHSGWHVGWFLEAPGWYFGWSYSWFLNAGGTWEFVWSFGWYFNETGWFYGWNAGWHVGWNFGWVYGWNYGWNMGWNTGWYIAWHLGWSI